MAALADIPLSLDLTRGALVAYKGRLVNSAVQRLRPPDDADAVLPRGQVSIAGNDRGGDTGPRAIAESRNGNRVSSGSASASCFPRSARATAVHAWSAVRPLYDPKARADGTDTRLRSRGFTILDHARTDNVEGIASIVGGKLAIFRLMAEKTSDLVCEKLGIDGRCRNGGHPDRLNALPAVFPAQPFDVADVMTGVPMKSLQGIVHGYLSALGVHHGSGKVGRLQRPKNGRHSGEDRFQQVHGDLGRHCLRVGQRAPCVLVEGLDDWILFGQRHLEPGVPVQ